MYQWHVVTIGHLSRNKFWGESEAEGYRMPVATCTLLKGHGEILVIDPSLPVHEMDEALVNAAGIHAEDVTMVYSTHFHFDHHVSYEAFPNAKWYMAPEDIRYLHEHWEEYSASWSTDSKETVGKVLPAPPTLCQGVTLRPMPGHTKGLCAVCFEGPEGRIVATGDAVMTKEFYQAQESYFFASYSTEVNVESIKALWSEADVVIPGHGEAFWTQAFEKK